MEKHDIPSRFTEAIECCKIINKETARVTASRALQQVVANVGRFEEVWGEIMTVGLPSCWDPTTPAVLLPLDRYIACLQEERDWTDLQTGKAAQLKADMIVSSLRKEFNLLHLIKHKLPTGAGFRALTEAFVEVEGFSTMPEPAADSQQRCT